MGTQHNPTTLPLLLLLTTSTTTSPSSSSSPPTDPKRMHALRAVCKRHHNATIVVIVPDFHNRILNPVPWRISKKAKEANPGDFLSEYQEAYKSWPFQPPRPPLKPEAARLETNVVTDMHSLYRKDFVAHPLHGNRFSRRGTKNKKEEVFEPAPPSNRRVKTTYKNDYTEKTLSHTCSYKPNLVYAPPVLRFNGRTEYQTAFEPYAKELAQVCRPTLVKPVESIEVTQAAGDKNASTCQVDYQAHSNVERPKPIVQTENKIQPDGPFQGVTMYMASYTKKPTPSPARAKVKEKPKEKSKAPFEAVSTFMADYKKHQNVKREVSCRPPEAKVTVADVPFANETTVSATYKPWPVSSKMTPVWARRTDYKPSPGKLLLSTTYMMDYKKPVSDNPPATPQIPNGAGESLLKQRNGNSHGDASTIYKGSYNAWENARPATPFTVKRNYEPPKEIMLFESTQRSHYKGEYTKRAEICRHVSEHRRLDKDKDMCFRTTYQDTYTSASASDKTRPKSSPSALRSNTRIASGQSPSKPNSDLNVSNDSGIDVAPSSPDAK